MDPKGSTTLTGQQSFLSSTAGNPVQVDGPRATAKVRVTESFREIHCSWIETAFQRYAGTQAIGDKFGSLGREVPFMKLLAPLTILWFYSFHGYKCSKCKTTDICAHHSEVHQFVCRWLLHPESWTHCHKWCPRHCWCTIPQCHSVGSSHPPVSDHQWCNLTHEWTELWYNREWDINWCII